MAANISMAGSIKMMETWPSSNTMLIKLSRTLVDKNMPNQVRPNTANARQLVQQAMKLKKILLAKGWACQCIRAGACQNKVDKGKYISKQKRAAV